MSQFNAYTHTHIACMVSFLCKMTQKQQFNDGQQRIPSTLEQKEHKSARAQRTKLFIASFTYIIACNGCPAERFSACFAAAHMGQCILMTTVSEHASHVRLTSAYCLNELHGAHFQLSARTRTDNNGRPKRVLCVVVAHMRSLRMQRPMLPIVSSSLVRNTFSFVP